MTQATNILARPHYGVNHFMLFTFLLKLLNLKPESRRVFFPSNQVVEHLITERGLSPYEFADEACPKLIADCKNILSKKVHTNSVDKVLEKICFHVVRKIELQSIIGIPLASMSFTEFENIYNDCVELFKLA
jgi:hypothetical protein